MKRRHAIEASNPRSAGVPPVQIPLDGALVFGVFVLVFVVELLSILVLNDGKFTYTLDDPYIHLAVAEQIAGGHYGVNPSEFSSPCSSALWPFLLAPLARTPIGEFVPLFINFGCGLLSCWILLRRARETFRAPDGQEDFATSGARVVMSFVILAGCNVVGIIFTGMEHSLQVLFAILVADGIIQLSKSDKVAPAFMAAVVIGPLVRYENFALTAVACLVVFLRGKRLIALGLGVGAVSGLAGFSFFLIKLGLPALPSSIVAKSHLSGDGNFLMRVLSAFQESFESDRGVLLLLMVAALLSYAVRPQGGKMRVAAAGLAFAGILHACFGAYGWYHRYECYVYGALLLGICQFFGENWSKLGKWTSANTAGFALFGLVLSFPYTSSLFTLPVAANNIYEQQYQMHRFATEWWKKPLAVNDLGWVTYGNDQYVLDLWGLGSYEALSARKSNADPVWMKDLAAKHEVGLVMVYENWVPGRTLGWVKVGELHLSRRRITPADSVVAFFATSEACALEIEQELVEFRKSLPPGVSLITRSEREKTKAN
jgi:hypothetical protein